MGWWLGLGLVGFLTACGGPPPEKEAASAGSQGEGSAPASLSVEPTEDSGAGPDSAWAQVPEAWLEPPAPGVGTGLPESASRAYLGPGGSVRAGLGLPILRCAFFDVEEHALRWPRAGAGSLSLEEGFLPLPKLRWPGGEAGIEAEASLRPLRRRSQDHPSAGGPDPGFLLQIQFFNPTAETRRVRFLLGLTPPDPSESNRLPCRVTQQADLLRIDGKPWIRLSRAVSFFGVLPGQSADEADHPSWEACEKGAAGGLPDSPPRAMVCAFDLDLGPSSGGFSHAASRGELEFILAAAPGRELPDLEAARAQAFEARLFWGCDAALDKPTFRIPHRVHADSFRSAVAFLMLAAGTANRSAPESEDQQATRPLESPPVPWNAVTRGLVALALLEAGHSEAAGRILSPLEPFAAEEHLSEIAGPARRGAAILFFAASEYLACTGEDASCLGISSRTWEECDALADQLQRWGQGDGTSGEPAAAAEEASACGDVDLAACWAVQVLEGASSLAQAAGLSDPCRIYEDAAARAKTTLAERMQERLAAQSPASGFPEAKGEREDPFLSSLDRLAWFWPHPVLGVNWSWAERALLRDLERLQVHWPGAGWAHVEAPRLDPERVLLAMALALLHRGDEAVAVLDSLHAAASPPGTFPWTLAAFGGAAGGRPDDRDFRLRAAAGFVILFRMLFLEERKDSVVIAPALPRSWILLGSELGLSDAPTRFGPMSYVIKTDAGASELNLEGASQPPGGYWLAPQVDTRNPKVTLDGQVIEFEFDSKRSDAIPIPRGTLRVQVDW